MSCICWSLRYHIPWCTRCLSSRSSSLTLTLMCLYTSFTGDACQLYMLHLYRGVHTNKLTYELVSACTRVICGTCLCFGSALEKQAPPGPSRIARRLSRGSFMNSTPVMLLPFRSSSAAKTPTLRQMASAVSLLSPVMTMTCSASGADCTRSSCSFYLPSMQGRGSNTPQAGPGLMETNTLFWLAWQKIAHLHRYLFCTWSGVLLKPS